MPDDEKIADLRSLLAEASRPSASVTIPLKQGLGERIRQAEAELESIAAEAPPKRMSATSPLKAKAKEIEALRTEMAESALTFRFVGLTHDQRAELRQVMGGRDNTDELNLRAIATMCVSVTTAAGVEFPDRMDWTDFAALRDGVGVRVFEEIDQAATRASGDDWSVPFSHAASLILSTEK